MDSIKKMDGNVGVEVGNNLKMDYMKTAEKVTDVAQEAKSAATNVANEAKSSANEAFKNAQKYCRENTGMAMGIAAAAGALISLALVKAFSEKESKNEKFISDLFRMWGQMKARVKPAVKNIKESVGM